MSKQYKSASAREAQAIGYGTESYWDYLDEAAAEHYAYRSDVYPNGIEDAYTASLADVLRGNDGD